MESNCVDEYAFLRALEKVSQLTAALILFTSNIIGCKHYLSAGELKPILMIFTQLGLCSLILHSTAFENHGASFYKIIINK